MREQPPAERVKNFDEVACGFSARRRPARSPSAACSAPTQPCVRGCPVGIDIPGFIQKIAAEGLPRRLRRDHRHQPAARDLRPRLPAGEPVRGRVHRGRVARAGRDRAARALGRRQGDRRGLGQRAVHRAASASASASSARARPAWPAPPTWPRPAATSPSTRPSTSRAACCKYGIPDFRLPNAVIDAEIGKLREAGRQVRVQHAGRAAVHDRADDRRARLPRRVRRHRRRLPEHARHPRRLAQRRAVGQRAAHALQPDARRSEFPAYDTPLPLGPARRGGRRRQHGDGRDARVRCASARRRCTASTAARAPKRRRAPRRSTTPRRKASSSTG